MGCLGASPLDLIRILTEGAIAFLFKELREPIPWELLGLFFVVVGISSIGGHEYVPQFVHLLLTGLSLVYWALEVHIVFRHLRSLKSLQLLFIIYLVLNRVISSKRGELF